MPLPATPLAGKVAIVTGSGRGLGLAYAAELARQGASVVVNDVDADRRDAAVAAIEAAGGKAVAVVAPVGTTETAQQLVAAAVENFGRLDILVTNAGVLRDTVLWKMSDDDFDTVINVHLRGTFTCVREAVDLHARERDRRPHHLHRLARPASAATSARPTTPPPRPASSGMVRTWALELQARRHHRERGHPGRRHRDDRDRPVLRRGRRGRRRTASRCPPSSATTSASARRTTSPGSSPILASDAAAGVTGQAIGVGGDRLQLWSHPEAVVTAYRDGGWTLRRARRGLRRRVRRTSCSPSARTSRRCRKTCSPTRRRGPLTSAAMTRYEPAHRRRRPRPRSTCTCTSRSTTHGHVVAAGRPGRGRRASTSAPTDRGPTLDSDRRRTTASAEMAAVVFTVDAGTQPRAHARSRAPRSPRAPRATTTC